MNRPIKSPKLHHIDFSHEQSLQTQAIRRVSHIKSIDLRHIPAVKNKHRITRLLKHTKLVKSFSLTFNFDSKLNMVFSALAQKHGVCKVVFTMPSNLKPSLEVIDHQRDSWYPLIHHCQNPNAQANNFQHLSPFITHIFPKSLTKLVISFSDAAEKMLISLSTAIKTLKNLETLALDCSYPYVNIPLIKGHLFADLLSHKRKLEYLLFNGHIARTSISNYQWALRESRLKGLYIYENFCKAWDFKLSNFSSLFEQQKSLENLELSVIGQNADCPKGCSGLVKLISSQSNIKNFKFYIDPQILLDQEEMVVIKEALANMSQTQGISLCYNHNYSCKATKEETDLVFMEISAMKQMEKVECMLKETKDVRVNLRTFKNLCNDVFHFRKLRKLDIKTKIEVQETALLYFLWSLKNMTALEHLKIKTILPTAEMAPLPELHRLPKFTTPTSLKSVSLEWASDFEYLDKIFDFIGLQNNLEHLHIGLIRTPNPSSKDCSKALSGLLSLNKLKSFHLLSTSFCLFKSGCLDTYAQIIKQAVSLDTVGLTFLAPFPQAFGARDKMQVNTKAIDLSDSLWILLKELEGRERINKLYLNFKIKAKSDGDLIRVIKQFSNIRNLGTLSLNLDLLFKKPEANVEEDLKVIQKVKEEILGLVHLKYLFLGVDKMVSQNKKIDTVLKEMIDQLSHLQGYNRGPDLPNMVVEKTKKGINM